MNIHKGDKENTAEKNLHEVDMEQTQLKEPTEHTSPLSKFR